MSPKKRNFIQQSTEMRTLLRFSPDALLVIDAQGTITLVNEHVFDTRKYAILLPRNLTIRGKMAPV
jgi:PAS domain-containing protein